MKLLFLGTGTAGSKRKYEYEIEEHRRRCSSLLLCENVLVDTPKQSFDYATKLGVDTSLITDVFLSHLHSDHYNKEAFLNWVNAAKGKINLWCGKRIVQGLGLSEEELEKVNICPLEDMDEFDAAGMHVVALPANHAGGHALHFVFERDGKRLFYGLDGAWFTPLEWRYIHGSGLAFDAMIIDSTNLSHDPIKYGNYGEHNNYLLLPVVVQTLRGSGVAGESTKLIAGHIGPHMNDVEAIEYIKSLGMIPAFDGLLLEI